MQSDVRKANRARNLQIMKAFPGDFVRYSLDQLAVAWRGFVQSGGVVVGAVLGVSAALDLLL